MTPYDDDREDVPGLGLTLALICGGITAAVVTVVVLVYLGYVAMALFR